MTSAAYPAKVAALRSKTKMHTDHSPESSNPQPAEPSPEHLLNVRNAWLTHPEVTEYIAVREDGPRTWAELRDEAVTEGLLAWRIPSRSALLHHAACTYGYGLADLTESDRAIIRHEYRDGFDRPRDPPQARWLLVQDTGATCPLDFPKYWEEDGDTRNPAWTGAAQAWATEYRASLPGELARLGMVVGIERGKPPLVAVWFEQPTSAKTLREWIQRMGGGRRADDNHDEDRGRFRVLARDFEAVSRDDVACGIAAPPMPEYIAIDPPTAANLDTLRTTTRATSGVVPTGVAEIDKLIRLHGTTAGGLTVFVAQEKNCKTLTMLQVAEHRASLGRTGVWIAVDESEQKIQIRRWQHRGLSEADGAERVARGEVVQDTLRVTSMHIDRVLQLVREHVAKGEAIDVYVDSLNAEAMGQHEIDKLVKAIKSTGATTFATAGAVGKGLDLRVRGSTGVAYESDLTCALKFDKATGALTLRVRRSRIADDGDTTLTVDTAGQRFVEAAPASPASLTDARLLESIRSALEASGPLSLRGIQGRVTGGQNDIARVLRAAVAAGEVTHDGKKYSLAE
jgi:hypothetical protein